ncbi:integrase family protein [Bradyrhizobium liaoningense]|uniref:integrase family protein n=1 Tax=Bradyrhizobium liaoningense TaxID=43992 RepID=UPI001BA9001E|nr:integrase family protein [Bradyrhizobium liaoningense]MBR0712724.1 integrase family protein [Bradyrhizobium liaoningense]
MARAKLTKKLIDAEIARVDAERAKREAAGDRRQVESLIWDTATPNFGIRIMGAGANSFVIQYKAAGKTKRHAIGRFGNLTLEQARTDAADLFAAIRDGGDPSAARKHEQRSPTMAELADDFLNFVGAESEAVATTPDRESEWSRKPKTLVADGYRVKVIKRSTVAAVKVLHITRQDVTSATYPGVQRDKSRPPTVRAFDRRALSFITRMLAWAVESKLRDDNPCEGLAGQREDRKRRWRLDATGYRTVGGVLFARVPEPGSGHNGGPTLDDPYDWRNPWQAVLAIKAMMLTGCRRDEVATLRRGHVDFVGSRLVLSDTKRLELADVRDGEQDIRFIGTAALDVFCEALRLGDADRALTSPDDFVFPSDRKNSRGHYTGGAIGRWAKRALAERKPAGWTVHGLRHCYASVCDDLEFSEVTKAMLIGHSKGSQTQDYIHKTEEQLRAAANKVAGQIAAWLAEGVAAVTEPMRQAAE